MKFACISAEIVRIILSKVTLAPQGRHNVVSLELQILALTLVLYVQLWVTSEARKLERDHWNVGNVARRGCSRTQVKREKKHWLWRRLNEEGIGGWRKRGSWGGWSSKPREYEKVSNSINLKSVFKRIWRWMPCMDVAAPRNRRTWSKISVPGVGHLHQRYWSKRFKGPQITQHLDFYSIAF